MRFSSLWFYEFQFFVFLCVLVLCGIEFLFFVVLASSDFCLLIITCVGSLWYFNFCSLVIFHSDNFF